MKTFLPNIEPRTYNRPNTPFGILNYDADNAYPQRVLEFAGQSPTATKCARKKAKFLHGNGFEEDALNKIIVNGKGLTLIKILKAVSKDNALLPGFAIQINYNAAFEIVELNFVHYEDVRQGDPMQERYRGKYVLYNDWGRRTWKNILASKFKVLDPYNPDPEVIKAQVIAAGGWDNWNGQLLYSCPVIDGYATSDSDSALEDFETEAGIKVFANREVTTGFLANTMVFMPVRREAADSDDGKDDFIPKAKQPTPLERDLSRFQGAKNAQKIITIEYEEEGLKPEFHPYAIQNNDKLFEVTEKSVEARIIKAFDIPKELISSESKNGLSNGGEMKEAIMQFNDDTEPERAEISDIFKELFTHWHEPVNVTNWKISEVTSGGSSQVVVQNSDKITTVITDTTLTYDNKVAILVYVYGIKRVEAEQMVPTDELLQQKADAAAAQQQAMFDQQNKLNEKEVAE